VTSGGGIQGPYGHMLSNQQGPVVLEAPVLPTKN
jgi:hypothetical protein